MQVVKVQDYLFQLLQLEPILQLAHDQFLFQGEDVVVELLDLALKSIPDGVEVVELGQEVSADFKQTLQRLGISLYLLVVFLNREVYKNLLLSHLLQVVVYDADMRVQVCQEINRHLLLHVEVRLFIQIRNLLNLPHLVQVLLLLDVNADLVDLLGRLNVLIAQVCVLEGLLDLLQADV